MGKRESSVTKNLKADGNTRREMSGKTSYNPLDDIALRVIVSNIPKHRATREEIVEEQKESNVNNEKETRLAA